MESLEELKTSYNHAFGRENETSLKQLVKFFCNNVYLGQWELARACLSDFCKQKETGGTDVCNLLIEVIETPIYSSLGSHSLISPYHLSWLSLLEFSEWSNENNQVDKKSLQEDVEFRLLINHIGIPESAAENVLDLCQYHKAALRTCSSSVNIKKVPALPNNCKIFLVDLLLRNPFLGHCVIQYLTFPHKAELKIQNEVLQMSYVEATFRVILHIRKIMKRTVHTREDIKLQVEKLCMLLSLFSPSTSVKISTMRQVFNDLLALTDQGKTSVIHLQDVYSALIGHDTDILITEFLQQQYIQTFRNRQINLEDALETICYKDLQNEIQHLCCDAERARAWSDWLLLCRYRHVHFLDVITDICLDFVKRREFDGLSSILDGNEMELLKALVLLLGWQYCSCVEDAHCLLEQLGLSHPEMSKNGDGQNLHQPLNEACKKHAYQIHLVQWCVDKTKDISLASTKFAKHFISDKVKFTSLESQSVLEILDNCTHLSALSFDDVLDILCRSPMFTTEGKHRMPRREKIVRFEGENRTDYNKYQLTSIEQDGDVALYKAFFVMKSIMDCISFMADTSAVENIQVGHLGYQNLTANNKEKIQFRNYQEVYDHFIVHRLEKCKEILSDLQPLTCRMEVLENIFSLLFLASEDVMEAVSISDNEEGELGDSAGMLHTQTSVESTEKEDPWKEENITQTDIQNLSGMDMSYLKSSQNQDTHENDQTVAKKTERNLYAPYSSNNKACHKNENQHQQSSFFGFIANEYLIRDLLALLKESLTRLNAAKFSLEGDENIRKKWSGKSGASEGSEKPMQTHIDYENSSLQHRITSLTQHVSEATWRFQLVSNGKIPSETGLVNENSFPGHLQKDYTSGTQSGREKSFKTQCLEKRQKPLQGQSSLESEYHLTTDGSVSAASTSSQWQKLKQQKKDHISVEKMQQKKATIIPRMLSSLDSLVNMCIQRDNYSQAKQVLQLFEIADSHLVSEVYFAENYNSTTRKILDYESKVTEKGSTIGSSTNYKKLRLSAVANVAAAAITSMSVTGMVDQLLSSSSLPHIQCEGSLEVSPLSSLLNHALIPVMVILDLLSTCSMTWKTLNDLLQMAEQRLPNHDRMNSTIDVAKATPGMPVKTEELIGGIEAFIPRLKVISDLGKIEVTTTIYPDILRTFYQKNAIKTLLTATRPLDVSGIQHLMTLFIEISKSLRKVEGSLTEASQWDVQNTKNIRPVVRVAFKSLIQTLQKHVPGVGLSAHLSNMSKEVESSTFSRIQYLQSLYEHVKALSTLQVNCDARFQDTSGMEYFLMLQESPTQVMGRLIFLYKVPPVRLENVAEKLNVNLTQIIVNNCCPLIPSLRIQVPRLPAFNMVATEQKLILNASGTQPPCATPPEQFVRELLTRLVQLMKEHAQKQNMAGIFSLEAARDLVSSAAYRHLLQSTSALQYVNLEDLKTEKEKMCFYGNLFNLFSVHVSLYEIEKHLVGKTSYSSQTSLSDSCLGIKRDGHTLEEPMSTGGNNSLPFGVIDRLMLQMKVAYRIGQLGLVSLFELRHDIMRIGLRTPGVFNNLLKDRNLGLDAYDPWVKFGPSPDCRYLFLLTECAVSSPVLQVLTTELLDQQFEVAMNTYLSHHIQVDLHRKQVFIPQLLDWYWEDFCSFTGQDISKPFELVQLLCEKVTGPVEVDLQQLLKEAHTEQKGTGLSESPWFEIKIIPFKRDFGIRFEYPTLSSADITERSHGRRSSLPSGFLTCEEPRSRVSSFIKQNSRQEVNKCHHLTPLTLDYLKAHSSLVATLVSLVCPDELDDIQNDFNDDYFSSSTEDVADNSPTDVSNFSLVDVRSYRYQRLTSNYPTMYSHVQHQIVPLCAVWSPQILTSADPVLKLTTSKMNDELRQYILHMSDTQHFRSLLLRMCKVLIQEKRWPATVSIMQNVCEGAVRNSPELICLQDFILCCAATEQTENSTDKQNKWKYLLLIRDNETVVRAVLGSLKNWSIDVCVTLLDMCSQFTGMNHFLMEAVKTRFEEMKIYQRITECAKSHLMKLKGSPGLIGAEQYCTMQPESLQNLTSWQDVVQKSVESPGEILELLLQTSEFDVARKWANIHKIPQNLKQTVEENYVFFLLEKENIETVKGYQVLEWLKKRDAQQCLYVCDSVLLQLTDHNNVLFVARFILHNLSSLIPRDRIRQLQMISIGASALQCIPASAKQDYEHLQSSPMLILEQLLMNSKVEWAEKVIRSIREMIDSMGTDFICCELCRLEDVDTLLTSYATKALEVPVIQDEESGASGHRDSLSTPLSFIDAGMRRSMSRTSISSTVSMQTTSVLSQAHGSRLSLEKSFVQRSNSPSPGSSPVLHGHFNTTGNPPEEGVFVIPAEAPTRDQWVPDNSVTHCMVCGIERFSMFNRRHHCRRCGRVVCSTCSMRTTIVRGKSSRTCDQCYHAIFKPRDSKQESYKGNISGTGLSQTPNVGSVGSKQEVGAELGLVCPVLDQWILGLDPEENQSIREEFYYDTAPNTSLSISILKLHSDRRQSGHVMLSLCDKMSKLLRPILGHRNPEIDYNQVLSIIKYLLFHAKLVLVECGDIAGMEQCEEFRAVLDLLHLLVSNNCSYIPSVLQLTKADTVRRLRDKLIEDERLPLAMEVSTKCGINAVGVWAAWGMACLRTGDYMEAREKFAKCLKPPLEKNHVQSSQKLLDQIITYLLSVSRTQSMISMLQHRPLAKDLLIEPPQVSADAVHMNETSTNECWYYLNLYAQYSTIINFYVSQCNYSGALNFILDKNCSSDIFVENLFLPCLTNGDHVKLEDSMLKIDSTLEKWNSYLTAVCRHLNKTKQTHCLYQLQLFMKDFIRAAMTCISDFFEKDVKSYSDLFCNVNHLLNAKRHLEDYLEHVHKASRLTRQSSPSPRWLSPSTSEVPVRISMTSSEVNRHINTISLQIETTKFLNHYLGTTSMTENGAAAKYESSPSSWSTKLPTLFGNNKIKAEVVHKILMSGNSVNDGFGLAFRIIQEFRLNATLIYTHTARQLAKDRKHVLIHHLLDCISNSGLYDCQSFDEVICACIRVMTDDASQAKEVENLIKMMQVDANKINAYILCGKLKSAYLIAVKTESIEDIRRIARAAERSGQAAVKRISEQWLLQHKKH